jgi:TonB family protein
MVNFMRTPKRFMLAAVALLLFCASAAYAQDAANAQKAAAPWVSVSPSGEDFVVSMPKMPSPRDVRGETDGAFVSGRRYEVAGDDSNTYAVWSLTLATETGKRIVPDNYAKEGLPAGEAFLDVMADFTWDAIVVPELEEAARRNEKPLPSASLIRFFELGARPAREYRVWLRNRGGPVYVYSDGRRAYLVAAFGPDPQSPSLKQFVESFKTKGAGLPPPAGLRLDPTLAVIGPEGSGRGAGSGRGVGSGTGEGIGLGTGGMGSGGGSGVGPGGGVGPSAAVTAPKNNAGGADAPVDYSKPFKTSEVTKKAVITSKPEPGFTESARVFGVTGVVRIRAILTATGTVEGVSVVKWLPHGLTQKALDAARRIRFEPAQKDGRPVSQYVMLEYNFNLY